MSAQMPGKERGGQATTLGGVTPKELACHLTGGGVVRMAPDS